MLVAEDDPNFGSIFSLKLPKEGYETVVVQDGEQALASMRQRKPDILLLDLVMPIKNGFEVLEEMRSDLNLRDIPVLILSNLSQKEDIHKTEKFGILGYLVKTDVSIDEMLEKLKTCLSQ